MVASGVPGGSRTALVYARKLPLHHFFEALKQAYQEGTFVKQGQFLFQIDPRPFQAALDQAQGQLAQAKAMLANAQAMQRRTELDVERYTPLVKEQAASQQDLDNAVQNNLAALATIETAKRQIKTYEATVETAKINLAFTRLVSPIDGVAGQPSGRFSQSRHLLYRTVAVRRAYENNVLTMTVTPVT